MKRRAAPKALGAGALELLERGDAEAAAVALEVEIRAGRGDHESLFHLARAQVALGLAAPAVENLRRSIRLAADFIPSYALLSRLGGGLDDGEASQLEALAASPVLDPDSAAAALFALAYECERRDDFAAAWTWFEKANQAKQVSYPSESLHARARWTKSEFSADRLRSFASRAPPAGAKPVFIVGMPRSGTTLLDRLLCRHPDLTSIGEPDFIETIHGAIAPLLGRLGHDELDAIASLYVSASRNRDSPALRSIDKYPMNFWNIGLIQILFPDAVVIHCLRDILDTCSSCYRQNFDRELSFSFSLSGLADYASLYLDLMEHWRRAASIPIIDVRYEELVAQPEAELRRVAVACGLDWTAASPDSTGPSAPVFTASDIQVRRPISALHVGRWKRYSDQLRPLRIHFRGGA